MQQHNWEHGRLPRTLAYIVILVLAAAALLFATGCATGGGTAGGRTGGGVTGSQPSGRPPGDVVARDPAAAASRINRPTFRLTATRPLALPGQLLWLTAEILGGDDIEQYYCPRVVWTRPDGTESATESDCPPWDSHEPQDYMRKWRVPASLCCPGMEYLVKVRWEKAGRVLGRAEILLQSPGER